jgi:hypothetical protein
MLPFCTFTLAFTTMRILRTRRVIYLLTPLGYTEQEKEYEENVRYKQFNEGSLMLQTTRWQKINVKFSPIIFRIYPLHLLVFDISLLREYSHALSLKLNVRSF